MGNPMLGLDQIDFVYAAAAFLVCYFIAKKAPWFLAIPALITVFFISGELMTHH